ncbi:NAD(P)-dependent alcohol dehydrogenase [Limosilactobacillus caccae]|uniref:NAD(P)-dependent alcohol dehydrogenase n=1 Tax=Limosilactobacillus caccae TaxID=1926284 RepID=UPI0009711CDD|nr:NAD(P)-dependent alcohol dehydrogenase [Limosilactobacillus caccae]
MQISAALVKNPGNSLKIKNLNLDDPKDNEVLIKIIACGICHTDAVGRDGGTSPLPLVLGHEGSGIVVKTGKKVNSVKPGDHVVLSFSYCGECENCRNGHPGMCEKFNQLNFAGKNFDGTNRISTNNGEKVNTFFGQSSLANYVVVNENGVVKVDKDVDLSLLGPLGCGIQTGAGTVLNYIKPREEQSIAIFGAGAVGLAAVMAAKIAGVKHIIAINHHGNRLSLAQELGATEVIDNSEVDAVKAIKRIIPRGVDYAIDTTGNTGVIKSAIASLAPAGECVLVGVGGNIELNLMSDLLLESKKLSGVVEGDSKPQEFIPKLVKYYKEGLFPFNKLVRFYKFNDEDLNKAFDDSKNGKVVKPIVVIND